MQKSNTNAEEITKVFDNYCINKNYQIKQTEESNNTRLEISNYSERTIVKIYKTGSVLIQGKQNSLKKEMEEFNNKFEGEPQSYIKTKSKTKACTAKYDIMLQEIRSEIKDSLLKIGDSSDITNNPSLRIAYKAKIISNSSSLTLTQFENGTLLLQGRTDKIFDEACDKIEKIANPSEKDVISRFISSDENSLQIFVDKYSPQLIDSAEQNVRQKIGAVFEYLEGYDQKWFVASECLCLTQIPLPEFSPIVMPASKAFEGFAKKLLVDIELFDKEHFKKNTGNFSNLTDYKNPSRAAICDKERNANTMLKKMNICLEMNRNFMMHSDNSQITKIDTFEGAEKKLTNIFEDVVVLYNYFVGFIS